MNNIRANLLREAKRMRKLELEAPWTDEARAKILKSLNNDELMQWAYGDLQA